MKPGIPAPALALILSLATLAPAGVSQSLTLPAGYLTNYAQTVLGEPFNSAADMLRQYRFDQSLFPGPPDQPVMIQQISVRPRFYSTTTVPGGSFSDVTVTLGVAADFQVPGSSVAGSFLAGTAQVVRSGPWAPGPISGGPSAPGPWIPLGFNSAYTYRPCQGDLVIQISKCGTTQTMGVSLDAELSSTTGLAVLAPNGCPGTSFTGGGSTIPVFRLDFAPVVSGIQSQMIPPQITPASTTTWEVPFNDAADNVIQVFVDKALLQDPRPLLIRELWVRTRFNSVPPVTVPGGSFNDVTITMGRVADAANSSATFASNFLPGTARVVRTGPWAPGPITGSVYLPQPWLCLGLTTPYLFDPCTPDDLVIELRQCGTVQAMGVNLAWHFGNPQFASRTATGCGAATAAGTGLIYPVLSLDYVPWLGTEWQLNQPGSSVDIDGVQATPAAPAVATRCPGTAAAASFRARPAQVGLPWESIIALAPVQGISAGALVTSGGQIVNLDLSAPILFLNGGAVPALALWPGDFILPFTAPPSPLSFAFQSLNVDPSHPEGLALSQAAELDVVAQVPLPPGPAGDDASTVVPLGPSTLCAASLPFAGTAWTSMTVCSNGRVLFGGVDNDPTPTVSEAQSDRPFDGFWTDLDPSLGGSIAITLPAPGRIRAAWSGVRYDQAPGTSVSFHIELDAATGVVTLGGLGGIGPNPGSFLASQNDAQFLGLSRGITGSTNSGPTLFAPGAGGVPAQPASMLYDFLSPGPFGSGLCPSLQSGVQQIVFTPFGPGNYTWTAS